MCRAVNMLLWMWIVGRWLRMLMLMMMLLLLNVCFYRHCRLDVVVECVCLCPFMR